MMTKLWLRTRTFLPLVLCVALVGCTGGKGATAKVKGRVKYFDKYLTCGTVAFTGADGRTDSANIDSDGNYEMAGAPVGEVTITVTVPQPTRGPAGGSPMKPPGNMVEMRPPGEPASGPPPSFDPSKIVQIPGKYADVKTSNMKYTVEKGPQEHNITLTP